MLIRVGGGDRSRRPLYEPDDLRARRRPHALSDACICQNSESESSWKTKTIAGIRRALGGSGVDRRPAIKPPAPLHGPPTACWCTSTWNGRGAVGQPAPRLRRRVARPPEPVCSECVSRHVGLSPSRGATDHHPGIRAVALVVDPGHCASIRVRCSTAPRVPSLG